MTTLTNSADGAGLAGGGRGVLPECFEQFSAVDSHEQLIGFQGRGLRLSRRRLVGVPGFGGAGEHPCEVLIERLFGDIHGDIFDAAFAECFFDGLSEPVEDAISEEQADGDGKQQAHNGAKHMNPQHFEVLAEGHGGIVEQVVVSGHFRFSRGRSVQGRTIVQGGRLFSASQSAEELQQVAGDGTRLTGTDLASVQAGDGNDFCGCACQETFIGDEDVVPCEHTFDDGDTGLAGQFHDGVASDAFENSGIGLRSFEDTLSDDEDVIAGAFRNFPIVIEHQCFDGTGVGALDFGHDVVEVVE